MKSDTGKIQLHISEEKISISDRMPIKFFDITIFLIVTTSIVVFLLGLIGILYSLFFSFGYVLFRYFAWMFWKQIDIGLENKNVTVTNMVFNKKKQTETITTKFNPSNLIFKEFEQSGMKRAMLQYKTHKIIDLLLLTDKDDIKLIKSEVFDKQSC